MNQGYTKKSKVDQSPGSERPRRDYIAILIFIVLFVLMLGIVFLNILGYRYSWSWVGVVGYESAADRTLWDWMELLLIPLVLAFGAYLLSKSEKAHERRIADQRRRTELELAEMQAQSARDLADVQYMQAVLDSYFDRMTDLLLSHNLRESNEEDEVRTIARTITLTVLKGLDGTRKAQVILFLYESALIQGERLIIDLSHADLSDIELPYAYLERIVLRQANLRRANLYSAKLRGADFYHSDLDEANLSWSDLTDADLRCGLVAANLGVASLEGSNLSRANLNGASLVNAKLTNAELRGANFKYRNPALGDIEPDNLHYATLASADLSYCDLSNALIDEQQLRGVRSMEGTTMPDGTSFEDWIEENRDKLKGR